MMNLDMSGAEFNSQTAIAIASASGNHVNKQHELMKRLGFDKDDDGNGERSFATEDRLIRTSHINNSLIDEDLNTDRRLIVSRDQEFSGI